jgi:hypothetical protein
VAAKGAVMGYQGKSARPADAMGRKITHTEDSDYEPGGAQMAAPRNPNHWYNRKPRVVRNVKEDKRIRTADKKLGEK